MSVTWNIPPLGWCYHCLIRGEKRPALTMVGGTAVCGQEHVGSNDPLESLGLPVRAYNLLKREGVNTVGVLRTFLAAKGIEGLDAMRNMRESDRDAILAAAKGVSS